MVSSAKIILQIVWVQIRHETMLDLIWLETLMVFLNDFFLKMLNLNQISRRQKFMINFPACRGNRQDRVYKMYVLAPSPC